MVICKTLFLISSKPNHAYFYSDLIKLLQKFDNLISFAREINRKTRKYCGVLKS